MEIRDRRCPSDFCLGQIVVEQTAVKPIESTGNRVDDVRVIVCYPVVVRNQSLHRFERLRGPGGWVTSKSITPACNTSRAFRAVAVGQHAGKGRSSHLLRDGD